MYLRKLRVRNLKLLRDITINFTKSNGEPRKFTMFVGENGLCKTSLLQAIAVAATGVDRANQLADIVSYPDLRRPRDVVDIEADFSFSETSHPQRTYPGLASPPPFVPRLRSSLRIHPGADTFDGFSLYLRPDGSPVPGQLRDSRGMPLDPLREARRHNLDHWFIAGYGVGRMLPVPARTTPRDIASPSRDRLLSLFKSDQRVVIGTGFADLFPPERAKAFSAQLAHVFVERQILPQARSLTLQALGHINNGLEQLKAHRLTLQLSKGEIDVPTVWLSDGYQGVIAWVADLVGQMWWNSNTKMIPTEEMEGICLVDQLDLYLHPRWQAKFILALKNTFPRIQFISNTHSPLLLPGLEKDEVIRLMLDENDRVVKMQSREPPALMNSPQLYDRFFSVTEIERKELTYAMSRYAMMASDPHRSAAQEREVQRLLALFCSHSIDPGRKPVPRTNRRRKRDVHRRVKGNGL